MRSYKEILDKVTPIYRQDPERFMRFYRAVNNIVVSIPEGKSIHVDDHCKPASRELFIDIACLFIMEVSSEKGAFDDYWEFIDDYKEIRHVAKCVPATTRRHFYSNRR